MPVNTTGLRCDYVKAWTHVKYLYDLSVDSAEKTAIQSHLNTYCGSSGGTPTNCNGSKTTAAAIPEGSPLNSTIALSCTGTASSTSSVTVSITHPYSGDITIALIAPDGTSRTLKAAGGSGAGPGVSTMTVVLDLFTQFTLLNFVAFGGVTAIVETNAHDGNRLKWRQQFHHLRLLGREGR